MGGDNLNVFNGDSKILFSTIKDGSIDLVVTDPPYGMDFQSNRSKSGPRYNKIIGDSNIDGWWLKESYRCLKNGGGLIFFFVIGKILLTGITRQ